MGPVPGDDQRSGAAAGQWDYALGAAFRDELLPRAVEWYLGEVDCDDGGPEGADGDEPGESGGQDEAGEAGGGEAEADGGDGGERDAAQPDGEGGGGE